MAQARHAAKRRGQRVNTAHLLLVLLQQQSSVRRVLGACGVDEGRLLSTVRRAGEESPSALESACKRGMRRAEKQSRPADALDLLWGVLKDGRSSGARCVSALDAMPEQILEQLEGTDSGMPSGTGRGSRRGGVRQSYRGKHSGAVDGSGVVPSSTARRSITPPRSGLMVRILDGSGAQVEAPSVAGSSADHSSVVDSSVRAKKTGGSKKKPPTKVREDATVEPGATPVSEGTLKEAPEVSSSRQDALAPKKTEPTHVMVEPSGEQDVQEGLDRDRFPVLSVLGRDLCGLAREGKLDPVLGRDREIEQLLDVVARRRSNNPLLIGEPGVGKTAVVEGLAQALACENAVPQGIQHVVEISCGRLLTGTGVRGALAERVRKIREEVRRSEGSVLLFFDEIHLLVAGEGLEELSGELKTALARGELPCVGATTEEEFRRHFEKDAALARRFSPLRVVEPDGALALEILEGVVPRYAEHHQVHYRAAALRAAVDLSTRYMTERQLPDKAVALLDQAGARVHRRGKHWVTARQVAEVVSEQVGVPVERLVQADGKSLLQLERSLQERIVGQDEAVGRVSEVIRKGASGLLGKRPWGTFLCLGPTGVGKTEFAKALSDTLFPRGAMTRIDLSEYSEAHSVARLLGSPPGYVGHEQGGQLTEPVRRRPFQLILLDEMEKAHPDVLLALLPMLDEGRLTDSRGRTVDFTQTVVVMTSNLGVKVKSPTRSVGFGAVPKLEESTKEKDAIIEAARKRLAPELWNRFDEVLCFDSLSRVDVREVAARMLAGLAARLGDQRGIELTFEDALLDHLVDAGGFDPELGARPMARTIGRLVESPLAKILLEKNLPAETQLTVGVSDGDVVFV